MIIIKTPVTKEDFKAYYALRYQILREPWGQPKGSEKDDYEAISEHFMAVDEATGEVVGAVKLFEKASDVGHFSHLVIARARQRQGIGRLLLAAVEARAKALGFHSLGTMTSVTATNYFEKLGYQIGGLPGSMMGTSHLVWMEKSLA
ncbi:MAG: hypothetical protein OHK0052_05990 [Anaerolineales bacterium]